MLVLEPCCCRELARTFFVPAMVRAAMPGSASAWPGAQDGARGVRPGHVACMWGCRAGRREKVLRRRSDMLVPVNFYGGVAQL